MAPAGLPMAANFNPTLFNGGISVTINANGAELVSLKNRAGLELLWPGRAGLATPRADTVSDRRPAQE